MRHKLQVSDFENRTFLLAMSTEDRKKLSIEIEFTDPYKVKSEGEPVVYFLVEHKGVLVSKTLLLIDAIEAYNKL